jgi:hypothetical protein
MSRNTTAAETICPIFPFFADSVTFQFTHRNLYFP